MSLATGFFGIPGVHRWTKVHYVRGNRPVCGSRVGRRMEFQWCAHGYRRDYVECARCRSIGDRNKP